jgi:hypothetical protein
MYGIQIWHSPDGVLKIQDNEIYPGTVRRGDSSDYYVLGAGIYNFGENGSVRIERNIIQGPDILSGNVTDMPLFTTGIISKQSMDGCNIDIINNQIYGGSMNAAGHIESRTSGVYVKTDNSVYYTISNNTVIGGEHPYRSYVVYMNVADTTDAKMYNNIFLSTGSASKRVILQQKGNNIDGCWNSLFVDAGSGSSCVLVYDTTSGDINSIDEFVDFGYGNHRLSDNPNYMNSYKSGTSGLFVSYGGSDGDYRTLTDNNWRLSSSAPAEALTGALTESQPNIDFTDDFYGYDRTLNSTWSMGACEYQ